ncbi:PP2C family protein-serine/threonine phosphatase [Streptomyces cadmiisoli]|uniref:PP2C family protein-serine/threonine phosphatase n=1 Tax=Streptomyces cadmiisoli TaxID=2184053 RepID=UPI00364CA370
MRSHNRSQGRPGAPSRPAGAGGHSRTLFKIAQCLPFAIALGVLVIEVSPAHDLVTGPVLTTTPALAALTLGPVGTLAAAAVALAVSVITATVNEAWGTPLVTGNFLGLLVVSLAGVLLSRAVRRRRQSELDQIRRVALAAQEVVLRPFPERLGPVWAAGLCLTAEAEAQIGGDLYDAVQTPYGVRLIVGDVRGKGLSAVRAVAAVLGAFREASHYTADLQEVMDRCEAALRREAALPGAYPEEVLMEGFTTALMAQVPADHVVRLVNRGHPPPYLLRQGKALALMPSAPQPPLGLGDLVPGPPVTSESHPFLPGDRLLLYTDGVIEARDRDSRFFPLPETMERIPAATTPREYLDELHQALIRHTGGPLSDDVAMILIDRLA